MALQLVFSGNLDPAAVNLSARFKQGTAFFVEAPLLTSELEIDVFLQVYLSGIIGEVVRNIPLGKIEPEAISLNVSDTETANLIPIEYQNTDLEMALLFLPSSATFLYATVIKPDCSLCVIEGQNSDLQDTLASMQLVLNQILAAVNIPVVTTGTLDSGGQFFFLQ